VATRAASSCASADWHGARAAACSAIASRLATGRAAARAACSAASLLGQRSGTTGARCPGRALVSTATADRNWRQRTWDQWDRPVSKSSHRRFRSSGPPNRAPHPEHRTKGIG